VRMHQPFNGFKPDIFLLFPLSFPPIWEVPVAREGNLYLMCVFASACVKYSIYCTQIYRYTFCLYYDMFVFFVCTALCSTKDNNFYVLLKIAYDIFAHVHTGYIHVPARQSAG